MPSTRVGTEDDGRRVVESPSVVINATVSRVVDHNISIRTIVERGSVEDSIASHCAVCTHGDGRLVGKRSYPVIYTSVG